MKVIILAGGFGTRLSEETDFIPKPLVSIGNKPIIQHIMDIYSFYGLYDFIILLGYKGELIEEHFSKLTYNSKWNIQFLNTGLNTDTGGRIKRAAPYIKNKPFMLTYGDGLSDINVNDLIQFHNNHNGLITMTSVQLASRFGILEIGDDGKVLEFKEKPKENEAWINGGFFMCDPKVIDYINNDSTIFEKEPLSTISREGKLYTFKHKGFWKCMDTLRDKRELENLLVLETHPGYCIR